MRAWKNRIGVVTGAASGIGAAIARDFLKADIIVAGLDKDEDGLKDFKTSLSNEQKSRFHLIKCDVTCVKQVNDAFDNIIKEIGGVDILVNNAGVVHIVKLSEVDLNIAQEVIQTNTMSALHCTQRAFKSMRERQFDGHIFFINSISGHKVVNSPVFPFNMYVPSKFAMTAMVELFRQEFRDYGSRVKVTNVCPGLVDTVMVPENFRNETGCVMLKPEDVSQLILSVLNTPPHVQIHDVTIKALGEEA